jgi:hypothetical protein
MQAIFTRIAVKAAAAIVAAVFLVAAGAFLCVALYEGLKALLEPWGAALATAGILVVLTVLVLTIGGAIARAAEKKAKEEAEKKGPATAKIGLELGKLLGENAAGYVGKNPVKVLIGTIVVGFLLGAFPSLRKFLASLAGGK